MRMWIDTEFNDSDLISMALVAEDGREWYEVTYCEKPNEWVAQNVMPILGQKPISKIEMQTSLSLFLSRYEHIHIVADWPEDIAHFCRLLITGPGMRLDTPELTMEIRRDLDANSKLPHNALADARAILCRQMEIERKIAFS